MVKKSTKKTAKSKEQKEAERAQQPPLKPVQCRGFMRVKLAEAFPRIVDGFVKQAVRGSCQHVKLASELLERRVSTRPSTKRGSVQKLLDELDGKAPAKRSKDELGRWERKASD